MDEGKRIVVTGGSGFIGSHLTRELLHENASVYVIDNGFSDNSNTIPVKANYLDEDIRNDRLPSIISEIDPHIIYHLAAHHFIPYCNQNPEETFEVNVMGTRNVLNAAQELDNLESLIYTSTAAVYPPNSEPHHESDPEGPTDIYGRTKLIGEDLVKLFAFRNNTTSIVVRLFNVYGPNETNDHLIPAILEQIKNGDRKIQLGNLTPARDFVYVDDVINALLSLPVEFNGQFRTFNVGTGKEWQVREVAESMIDALDGDIKLSQNEARTRDSDRMHLRASTDRIKNEIGWGPEIDLMDGLYRLLETEGILE